MYKKFLVFLIVIFFQSSSLYSREFNYEAYGLNINFMKIKFKETDSKIYSIINSKGLVGYFVNFQNIIQTIFDKRNNSINYYFNLKKKIKKKFTSIKK